MTFVQAHTEAWLDVLRRRGHPDARPLAAGVEGALYRLGDGRVAKVWGQRRVPELLLLQGFYADVAAAGLPFRTPEILAVEEIDGTAVTFERELPGTPLQERLGTADGKVDDAIAGIFSAILAALRTVAATDGLRALPVLDEPLPLWRGAADFPAALTALIERRLASSAPVLRARVADLDRKHARVTALLAALERVPSTVLHGDLFGENVLVDEHLRPTAVLDFGYLSTAGDPRLDAAITASIVDMYGPHARAIASTLDDRFVRDLGYPRDVLLLYRAAYALATSNAFTTDGSDGHFAWCAAWLDDAEVVEALGP